MKTKFLFVAASAIALNACGQAPQNQEAATLSADESYLLDAVDSTADDSASASTTTSSSVAGDLQTDKLQKRASRLLEVADEDKSESLSLEEFLAAPEKMHAQFGPSDRPAPSAAQLEKIKTRMTEAFQKFAGDDAIMSKEELIQYLTESAPRISHHRDHGTVEGDRGRHRGRGHGRNQGKDRAPPSSDEIITSYDKNGDGLLSKEEFDAFLADRRAKHDQE